MGVNAKYLLGFRCDSPLCAGDVISLPMAAVNVAKGDILVDNGSGYVTNASITAFADGIFYVALEPVNNSAGASGDLNILCIVPNHNLFFWVPNESATVAAQTDVGEVIDLESEDGVDVTDTTLTAWGFAVVDIDISTAALAAAAGGFVKGHFMVVGETT